MAIKDELASDFKEEDGGQEELAALDALEAEAKEFDKDAEIDRILKAFKLDAYAVLDLNPGVAESDIKKCYRVKSLLIHPDKTSNPQAPDAFDRLKKAQTVLMDEKQRTHLDESISDARTLLIRELKLTIDSPEVKSPSASFMSAWRAKTVYVLVDNEQRRRKQLKAQLQEEGREQRKVDEEIESRKRRREHEVEWEKTRETRIGSWRDFQGKGKVGASAGAGVGGAGGGEGAVGKEKGGADVDGGVKKKSKKLKMKVLG